MERTRHSCWPRWSSSTIRVHPCRLQKVGKQNGSAKESIVMSSAGNDNDLKLDNHRKVSKSKVNEKQNHFEGVDDSDTGCEVTFQTT